MGRQIVILAALQYEADAIAKAVGRRADVRVCVIGPGAARLSQIRRDNAAVIIMAGVAGALDPELAAGDIVVDEHSDCDGLKSVWRKGRIHSAPRIVETPEQKREIFHSTGALIVDMENDAARRLAGEWGVPYVGLRAVLDRADEALDPAMLRLIDGRGRVRAGRLMLELLRRPALLITLLRMRSRSALALDRLADAVDQLIQQDCFTEPARSPA